MGFTKKVPSAFIFLVIVSSLISSGFSSEIVSESVEIDIGDLSDVTATVHYHDITSNKLSYLVPYEVISASVRDNFGSLSCNIVKLQFGTEFLCDPRSKLNYSVVVNYKTEELVSQKEGISKFHYEHQILDPTQEYDVRVFLPEGFGLLTVNTSLPPTSPLAENIGSTGRRIFVEWSDKNVSLGDTVSKIALYESVGFLREVPILVVLPIVFLILLSLAVFFFMRRKKNQDLLFALKDDERRVVEYVQQQGGKCRQRDVVRDLDLSKAKASRLITDLEERNILVRIKRGRNNLIRLKPQ